MSEPAATPDDADSPAHGSAPPPGEASPTSQPLGQTDAGASEDDRGEDYEEQLPDRARRSRVMPLNLSLLAVMLVAGGFVGGVLVEKGHTASSNAATGAVAASAGAPGATVGGRLGAPGTASLFAGAGASATTGTVSLSRRGMLYITDSRGNTILVKAAAGGTVTRTVISSARAIHPGDTVVVAGPTASSGTITATSIRATAANAASSGVSALLGGAGPTGSAGPDASDGAAPSASPSLFGSG